MAELIRKSLFWLLAALATLFLSSFVAKPLDAWLISIGYYKAAPGWILQTVEWFKGIAQSQPFQFLFVSILSGAAGAWSHYLAAKHDSTRNEDYSGEFIMMRPAISNTLSDIWAGLRGIGGHDFYTVNEKNKVELNALYARLKRIGIKTPETEGYDQPWQYNAMQIGYLEALIPYARNGLIPEVKVEIDSYLTRQQRKFKELKLERRMPREFFEALRLPR